MTINIWVNLVRHADTMANPSLLRWLQGLPRRGSGRGGLGRVQPRLTPAEMHYATIKKIDEHPH